MCTTRTNSKATTTVAIYSCRICLTNHMGSISCHITPLVINSLGANTQTHKHAYTHIQTSAQKHILRKQASARHRPAHTWFKTYLHNYVLINSAFCLTRVLLYYVCSMILVSSKYLILEVRTPFSTINVPFLYCSLCITFVKDIATYAPWSYLQHTYSMYFCNTYVHMHLF